MEIEYLEIDYDEIVAESEMAICLRLDGETEQWIPKSVMSCYPSDGVADVAAWFAEREGLI